MPFTLDLCLLATEKQLHTTAPIYFLLLYTSTAYPTSFPGRRCPAALSMCSTALHEPVLPRAWYPQTGGDSSPRVQYRSRVNHPLPFYALPPSPMRAPIHFPQDGWWSRPTPPMLDTSSLQLHIGKYTVLKTVTSRLSAPPLVSPSPKSASPPYPKQCQPTGPAPRRSGRTRSPTAPGPRIPGSAPHRPAPRAVNGA